MPFTSESTNPDKLNGDASDPEGKLYDAEFGEADPEVLRGDDVLVTCTPEDYAAIMAGRQ